MPHFTLYVLAGVWATNPIIIGSFLEELGLEYQIKEVPSVWSEKKGDVTLDLVQGLNPNGLVPILVDHHNNDLRVWESGAILQYLGSKYDTSKKYIGTTVEEQAMVNQWLFFHATGYGATQSQLYYIVRRWDATYHEAPPKNVLVRFSEELHRTMSVLEEQLSRQAAHSGEEGSWLVLDHPTIADFAVFSWLNRLPECGEILGVDLNSYPNLAKYAARSRNLPSVKAVRAQIDQFV